MSAHPRPSREVVICAVLALVALVLNVTGVLP